jgi:hypothetical protein
MAADQPNRAYQLYVDDNGAQWNVMAGSGGPMAGLDGHAAFDPTKPVWGRQTKRRHVRSAVFQDPTTFRIVKGVIFTPTAWAALAAGTTVAVHVPGETATVTYTLSDTIPERQPKAKASRQDADHA